jgi:hypothetical protein
MPKVRRFKRPTFSLHYRITPNAQVMYIHTYIHEIVCMYSFYVHGLYVWFAQQYEVILCA